VFESHQDERCLILASSVKSFINQGLAVSLRKRIKPAMWDLASASFSG